MNSMFYVYLPCALSHSTHSSDNKCFRYSHKSTHSKKMVCQECFEDD